MAIMVPSFPYGFTPASREDELFECLQNKLSDDYYVFHSFKLADLKNGTWKEKEIDFVIYNKAKGLMFIEVKAGQVWCDNGQWKYQSGIDMKDPFKQADNGRWEFFNMLDAKQKYVKDPITNRCKMLHAVWFPSIFRKQLSGIVLPQNARPEIILTGDDLDNGPQATIEKIYDIQVRDGYPMLNTITDADDKYLMDNILCPKFNIIPPKSFVLEDKRRHFDAMLEEQYGLLNYLEYQRNAVINGAAGTGKTMIAIEKARRHAEKGESVLFLCFNIKLKEFLEKAYPMKNVSYYTIDGFACKMCSTAIPDYNYLQEVLYEYYDETKCNEFPYTHIIIDEGQDFGQKKIHADEIFNLLESIVLLTETGTFYIFYDKMQLIQAEEIPDYITKADCKLTLYKNCRNTKRIAETSFKVFDKKQKPKLFDAALSGDIPFVKFIDSSNYREALDKEIGKSFADGITDIQILCCSSSGKCEFDEFIKNEFYFTKKGKQIPYTTCRKFKGLEAEKIILVGVDKDSIFDNEKMFYVGSSRAKLELTVLASMSEEDCKEVLSKYKVSIKKNDPFFTFAKYMACDLLK